MASFLLLKVLSHARGNDREASYLPSVLAQPLVLTLIGAHWEAGLEQARGLSCGNDSMFLILRCSWAVELDLGAGLHPTESRCPGMRWQDEAPHFPFESFSLTSYL